MRLLLTDKKVMQFATVLEGGKGNRSIQRVLRGRISVVML